MPKSVFKNDKFKRARGSSKLLNIYCSKCNEYICQYQKDGHGALMRMYHDRITKSTVSISKKDLSCVNHHLLGVEMVYVKENRLAFRLLPHSIIKNIVRVN